MVGAGHPARGGYDVPQLPLVVVSRSADLPPTLRDAPRGRILMATVALGRRARRGARALGEEQRAGAGRGRDRPRSTSSAELADRGWTDQLCEGGPSLFADLLAAGVVDELCWTIVPRLTGGDAVRIAAGAEVDVTLRPALLLEQDGTLLGRWLVEPATD